LEKLRRPGARNRDSVLQLVQSIDLQIQFIAFAGKDAVAVHYPVKP
jgi:hypothetical protein